MVGYMMRLDNSALSKGQLYPWRRLNIADSWVGCPVACEGGVAVPGPVVPGWKRLLGVDRHSLDMHVDSERHFGCRHLQGLKQVLFSLPNFHQA